MLETTSDLIILGTSCHQIKLLTFRPMLAKVSAQVLPSLCVALSIDMSNQKVHTFDHFLTINPSVS